MSQTQITIHPSHCLIHALPFETLLLKPSMTFYIAYDIKHFSLSQWFFCYKACQSNSMVCTKDMTILSQRMCPVCTHTAAILQTLGAQNQFGLLLPVNGRECNPVSVCICISLSKVPHPLSSPSTSPLHVWFLWSLLSLNNSFLSLFCLFACVCEIYLHAHVCMFSFTWIYVEVWSWCWESCLMTFPPYSWRQGFPVTPRACWCGDTWQPVCSSDPLSLSVVACVIGRAAWPPNVQVGSEDLNSGSHACGVSAQLLSHFTNPPRTIWPQNSLLLCWNYTLLLGGGGTNWEDIGKDTELSNYS